MTDIERWKVEHEALGQKIAAAEARQRLDRARKAFRLLGTEEDLPLVDIVEQAMSSCVPAGRDKVLKFLEHVAAAVEAHRR